MNLMNFASHLPWCWSQSCRRATVHKPSSACKGAQQNDEDQNKKQAFWFLWDEIGVVDLIDVTLAFQNLA